MLEIVLIRGLPGSGKSTIAKKMDGFSHFEADMFFTDEFGNYNYNPKYIREAHEWCQSASSDALRNGKNVVVSNTFTRHFEMSPYIKMANKYGAKISVIVATGKYKNEHGVPDSVIENMRARWEE